MEGKEVRRQKGQGDGSMQACDSVTWWFQAHRGAPNDLGLNPVPPFTMTLGESLQLSELRLLIFKMMGFRGSGEKTHRLGPALNTLSAG